MNDPSIAEEGKQPHRLPWGSLNWQLVFLTILPLTVLALVVAFVSTAVHQNAMRSMVGERDVRAVRMAAAALEEQVHHRAMAVRSLALVAESLNGQNLEAYLVSQADLITEFDIGLAFFGPQGGLAHASAYQEIWQSLAIRLAPHFQAGGVLEQSPLYLPADDAAPSAVEPLVVVIANSPSGGWKVAGAFSAVEMSRHTLSKAFAGELHASITVLDGQRRVLYQGGSSAHPSQALQHPGVERALRGESGAEYLRVGNEEHVAAFSPVSSLGWALVLEEPWEMVESPALRASQLAPLILAPALILAVVALAFGARQIVQPLQTLASRAAGLAGGDFQSLEEPVGGVDEIRQLQNELILMARQVQAAQQSLRGYIGAITTAQEEERRRLARELHDDTIQALIALKQRVQLTQLAMQSGAETPSLQEIAILTEQTIDNLRRLTRALRPIYLEDLGLVTALEMLASEVGEALNIPVDFHREGAEIRLEPAVELSLYRMAQEAMNNIARHAEASRAFLGVEFSQRGVSITIEDNGKGFHVPKSPAQFAQNGHYGLLGMFERADLISAKLSIFSAPGQATRLQISLSLPDSSVLGS